MVSLCSDAQLLSRCLAGHQEAWAELYRMCQPVLLQQIKSWLGPLRACGELAEEIAARVWLKLVERNHLRLSKFDPNRGVKVTTFLVALARYEHLMMVRERNRRSKRELQRAMAMPSITVEDHLSVEIGEYLEILDAMEKAHVVGRLIGMPSISADPETQSNDRRLNRNLLNKLRAHMKSSKGGGRPYESVVLAAEFSPED